MTMRSFSARNIQGVWFSLLVGLAAGPTLVADAGSSRLARGIQAFENRKFGEAIQELKGAPSPELADYAAFYLASAREELQDFTQARSDLALFHKLSFASPFEMNALLLEAKALTETGSAAESIKLLKARYDELPQPPGDLRLAQAYEAAQDPAQAAAYYQRVYYLYPLSDSAARAGKALDALKEQMGSSYPAPPAQQRLDRGNQFLAARAYPKARAEFAALREELSGADRDTASVRLGAADFLDKRTGQACPYLRGLEIAPAEADAERLYYVAECDRVANDNSARLSTVASLAKKYPASAWRLKALVSAGNRYMLLNQPDSYVPLFRACYEAFPSEPEAANCHWRVTWAAYLERRKDAAELLREQVMRYPASSNTSAALYYLGRLSERAKDFRAARGYYDKIAERYPGYYYGILAKEQLAQPDVARAAAAETVADFLKTVTFPPRSAPETYEPTPATNRRIARFRLLSDAGLSKLAEAELRFGAKRDGQPHLLAMELAGAEEPHQGIRSMKSLVSDYFTITPDKAPGRFWELLFPLPFRGDLVKQASASALDPNIVAGLVRQESEFNPKVISPAHACGLTQLVPATGRQLARQAGVRRFSSNMLFQPAMNLQLGTTYLRSLLDQWGGKWEQTLASYNAGKTHVLEWIKWGDFQEPAEFVETIPFPETRDYVQSVMRNAAAYRRIYGSRMTVVEETAPVKKIVAPVKSAPKKAKRAPLAG